MQLARAEWFFIIVVRHIADVDTSLLTKLHIYMRTKDIVNCVKMNRSVMLEQQVITNSFINTFSGLTESYFFYNNQIELRFDKDNHEYLLHNGDNLESIPSVTQIVHIIDKSNALVPWAAKMVVDKLLRTIPTMALPTGEIQIGQMSYSEFESLALAAKSAPRDKVEEAADVGHQAHAWIEAYIKKLLGKAEAEPIDLSTLDERVQSCCNAALKWMAEHNVRWLSTELKIYSRLHQYAGTMDGEAFVDSCTNPLCCETPFKNRRCVIDWKSSNYLYIEYLLQTAAYQQALEEEFDIRIDDRWIIRLGKTDGEFEPWHLTRNEYQADWQSFKYALELYRLVRQLEERMGIKKAFIKEQKKKEKDVAKAAALAIKCKAADKYKGIKPPKCNGGNPCQTCIAKYNEVQKEKNG